MSQVAQQDHLYIEVGVFTNLTDAEKQLLVEKYNAGVILDVVLRNSTGVSKCIGAQVVEMSGTRVYSFKFGMNPDYTVTVNVS